MEAKPWHSITEGWMPLGAGEGFREEVTFDSQFWRVSWSLWVELPLLMPAVWREVTEDGRRNQGDSADSWRNESKTSCPFLPGRTGLDGDSCSWRQGQNVRVWRQVSGRLRRRERGELPGEWGDKRMCEWPDLWAKEPSVAAETEREKEKLSLLAGNPSYCSGNARPQRPMTCQLLKETRVGRPHFLSRRAWLPDRIWIEWLAFLEPRLIGLKEKKCYFSSHETTKRNGETKILFHLNKLQGDSLGHFQGVRWGKALKYHSIKLNF